MDRRMPGRPASRASNSGALNPTTTLGRTARSCSRESLPPKNRSSPTVSPRPASSTMRPSSSMTSIRPLTTRWIASGGSSTSPRPSSSQAADSETWSRSASSSGPRTGCRLHSSSRRCIRSRASRSGADRSAQLSTSPPGTFARWSPPERGPAPTRGCRPASAGRPAPRRGPGPAPGSPGRAWSRGPRADRPAPRTGRRRARRRGPVPRPRELHPLGDRPQCGQHLGLDAAQGRRLVQGHLDAHAPPPARNLAAARNPCKATGPRRPPTGEVG